jgi:hypothetical protein
MNVLCRASGWSRPYDLPCAQIKKSDDLDNTCAKIKAFWHKRLQCKSYQRLGAVLYPMPRTSALGSMRLTGHHGGATATSVRVGEPCVAPVVRGQLLWEGLFRREERRHVRLPW